MKIMEFQDAYNKEKIWIVKVTNCGHYYINQKIKGGLFYRKYVKVTKKYLMDIGVLKLEKLKIN